VSILKKKVTYIAAIALIGGFLFFNKNNKTPQVSTPKNDIAPVTTIENVVDTEKNLVQDKFKIDRDTHNAIGKNNRIKYIILHYTVIDDEASIRVLTTKNVSAHYLVTTKDEDDILSLVPDDERAWHAGASSFAGKENLNDTSIGIEIVNPGLITKREKISTTFPQKEHYAPYTEIQIEKIAFLLTELAKKYNISPQHIIGHSDIAPGRKPDPGPQFPWKRLHEEYNIGAWYDQADYDYYSNNKSLYFEQSISDIKKEFVKYGYTIKDMSNQWDNETKQVIQAFQSHFRPEEITGKMDISTFAILKSLNKKYHSA
jgi:N-acetyl-anhydromuramyl-L-alanine amidase AmpD